MGERIGERVPTGPRTPPNVGGPAGYAVDGTRHSPHRLARFPSVVKVSAGPDSVACPPGDSRSGDVLCHWCVTRIAEITQLGYLLTSRATKPRVSYLTPQAN